VFPPPRCCPNFFRWSACFFFVIIKYVFFFNTLSSSRTSRSRFEEFSLISWPLMFLVLPRTSSTPLPSPGIVMTFLKEFIMALGQRGAQPLLSFPQSEYAVLIVALPPRSKGGGRPSHLRRGGDERSYDRGTVFSRIRRVSARSPRRLAPKIVGASVFFSGQGRLRGPLEEENEKEKTAFPFLASPHTIGAAKTPYGEIVSYRVLVLRDTALFLWARCDACSPPVANMFP